MEGRAIARPNRTPPARPHPRTYTFNGGPSNCSAEPVGGAVVVGDRQRPSMEGRAIARPNMRLLAARAKSWPVLQWRAEQLLGRTWTTAATTDPDYVLQWRAEQLLGRTGVVEDVADAVPVPSMEGRAIARPNREH